jgi:methyl-accepting chemotaxis protein
MKLRSKIILLTACTLGSAALLLTLPALWQLRRSQSAVVAEIEAMQRAEGERIGADGAREVAALREELLARKREYLQSQVQTALSVLGKAYADAHDPERLKRLYRDPLTNAVNTAFGILETVAAEPDGTLAEKQQKAARLIGALRYGPENKDYFWINDLHPRMVMHPYKPELNGSDLRDHADPNGKQLFVAFVDAVRETGEGFVDYHWPKYGADRPQPKLSFVKLFKQWGWIVGSGLYSDDIEALLRQREAEMTGSVQTAAEESRRRIGSVGRQIADHTATTLRAIALMAAGVLLLGLLASALVTRGIIRPILRVIAGLDAGAGQVSAAASQISAAGRQSAEGSSAQAAAIEETSASLEELSAMTRQNAESAAQADGLMKAASQVVARADGSMGELTASMAEITRASRETGKIVKTIDEIAFQTNLLALNAAVEAARAGEAGAGFAVVADEVRNLAMRAAEAARTTAALIEGTVAKVKGGSELAAGAGRAFAEVAASAAKVGGIVSEIAAASREQALGIGQVNAAVAEMDKVTQANAAGAEESASAAAEMSAQAEGMKALVIELAAVVGGRGARGGERALSAACAGLLPAGAPSSRNGR